MKGGAWSGAEILRELEAPGRGGEGGAEVGDAEVFGGLVGRGWGRYGVWWGKRWGVQRAVGTEGGDWGENRILRAWGGLVGRMGGLRALEV